MKIKTLLPLLAAASGLAFTACTHREADDVPTSSSSSEQAEFERRAAERRAELARADAEASDAGAAAKTQAVAAKAESERLAGEGARIAADNEASAKAEGDRPAVEPAAKPASEKPATPVPAQPEQPAPAVAETKAEPAPAQPTEPAPAPPAPVVAETKAQPADPAPVVAESAPAPTPAAPLPAKRGDIAAAAKAAVAALVIPEGYTIPGRRTIVQVNRARAGEGVVVDKGAVTAAVIAAVDATGRFLSSDTLNAKNRRHDDRAIYLALDLESKALGFVPSRKLSDAPALFLNIAVTGDGAAPAAVTVIAIDTDTGKVIDSSTKTL